MPALLRAIAQGDPKSEKTSAVVPLLDAGYRVVMFDFDHNPEPIQVFAKDLSRFHLVTFADELGFHNSSKGDERFGLTPTAVSAVRQWQKFMLNGGEDAEGRKVPPLKQFGPGTIAMADSLTSIGESAMHLALRLNNYITREGSHINVMADEVEAALGIFMTPHAKCHRYLTAHLKLIGPKPESLYAESDPVKAAQQKINLKVKQERMALEETKFFPNMAGIQFARNVSSKFSTALLFEIDGKGDAVIRTKPLPGYTIGVPAEVADPLPARTGLLTIMQALGWKEVPQ